MIGVNFQPGANQDNQNGQNGQSRPSGAGGIQEAIKILSLRLPKVVGAQGVTPMALLTSQGGGGSRVDSVVNQVMARMGQQPQPAPSAAPAPMGGGQSGPNFSGQIGAMYGGGQPQQMTPSWPMPPTGGGGQQLGGLYRTPHVDMGNAPPREPVREAPSIDYAPPSPSPMPPPPEPPPDLEAELRRMMQGGFGNRPSL